MRSPNPALQRTATSRRGRNRCASLPPSTFYEYPTKCSSLVRMVCMALFAAGTSAHADSVSFSIERVTFEIPRGVILLGAVLICGLAVGAFILFRRRG
jgi:uncharacterized integral membrane protein